MKFCELISLGAMGSIALAADVPKVLSILPEGQMVKAATTVVLPPAELDKYVAMVDSAARKNPEWFAEHSKKASPGVPLPYDEKLGLTKEQYDEYLALWDSREFKAVDPVVLQLHSGKDNKWTITTVMTEGGKRGSHPISTLKYDPEQDVWISPNGTLKRLEDVKADKRSILGEWSGHEWRFEEETSLGKTKENLALGKTEDNTIGMIIYRMQEVSSEGTRLYDKSTVIRFLLGKDGYLTAPKR